MEVDYGRAEIAGFKQAAAAGTVHLDPEAVTDVVRLYDHLIGVLQEQYDKSEEVVRVGNLGGFRSGQQLATGFSNKGAQFQEVLTQYIEGAMRIQEAFLIAGGRLEEADQKNAAALRLAAEAGQ